MGIKFETIKFIDPPSDENKYQSLKLLQVIDAIDAKENTITECG